MKDLMVILEVYNDGKIVHISHKGSFGHSYDYETIKDLLLNLLEAYIEEHTND